MLTMTGQPPKQRNQLRRILQELHAGNNPKAAFFAVAKLNPLKCLKKLVARVALGSRRLYYVGHPKVVFDADDQISNFIQKMQPKVTFDPGPLA